MKIKNLNKKEATSKKMNNKMRNEEERKANWGIDQINYSQDNGFGRYNPQEEDDHFTDAGVL